MALNIYLPSRDLGQLPCGHMTNTPREFLFQNSWPGAHLRSWSMRFWEGLKENLATCILPCREFRIDFVERPSTFRLQVISQTFDHRLFKNILKMTFIRPLNICNHLSIASLLIFFQAFFFECFFPSSFSLFSLFSLAYIFR